MANSLKGEVPLTLSDGRELVLVMDYEALIEAEGAYGKPLQQLMADASVGFVAASRALLYGALRAKHSRVTVREASGMLFTDGEAVQAALAEAVEIGFPDAKGGKENPNPPAAQAGKTSGRNGAQRASSRTPSSGQPRAHTN